MTPKPGENVSLGSGQDVISEEEAALYDRQIRLWGVEAQKKLRGSNVLLIGLNGLGSEIVKNLVLAGIKSLTVFDHQQVSHGDSLNNLFSQQSIGQNRAVASEANIKILNPNVSVVCQVADIREILERKGELQTILESSDIHIVILNNADKKTAIEVNRVTREAKKLFYFTGSFGMFGFAFNDFGEKFEYMSEVKKSVRKEIEVKDEDNDSVQGSSFKDNDIIYSGEVASQGKEEGEDGNPSPTKKIKLNDETKKKENEEQEDKTYYEKKEMEYIPLETALAVKAGKVGVGLTNKSNPIILLMHILLDFAEEYGHFPKDRSDIPTLELIENKVMEKLGLGDIVLKKLKDLNYTDYIYGELSAISSIVGGVVGQDVIRGVTNKETPLRNVFLFNGIDCNGVIQSIG